MRLLDPRFKYIPSAKTDIAATFRRYGFRPTTDAERRARQRTVSPSLPPSVADLDLLDQPRRFRLTLVRD